MIQKGESVTGFPFYLLRNGFSSEPWTKIESPFRNGSPARTMKDGKKRKMNECVEKGVPQESASGQHPRQQDAHGQAESDAACGHAQAQVQGLAFAGAQPHHDRQFTVQGFMRVAVYCAGDPA